MDIVEQLRGEQKQQQDDYGRGLAVLDDAADEIARLRDENESLRCSLEEWRLDLNSMRDENAKLRADAERYRWLKARNSGSIGITTFNTDEALERVLVEGDADTEIDAAMQKGE